MMIGVMDLAQPIVVSQSSREILPAGFPRAHDDFANLIAPAWDGELGPPDERLLLPLLRLHLHRFHPTRLTEPGLIQSEARRLAGRLISEYQRLPEVFHSPPKDDVDLRATRLGLVGAPTAMLLHRQCHYLSSPRANGIHLGLHHRPESENQRRLVSLATLSTFDLRHLADALPFHLDPSQVLVLSRFIAAPWAPPNTGSCTLGKIAQWLRRERREIRMLLTYLDPNVGFRGALYRAANWIFFGREKKRRYLFLDGDYVTDRQMISRFGTADFAKLQMQLGGGITRSAFLLDPLDIYVYFPDPALRTRAPRAFAHEFSPPSALVGA